MERELFEPIDTAFHQIPQVPGWWDDLAFREVVEQAYESLLGYDVEEMANADERIGYWVDRLTDDLEAGDFVPEFLQAAHETAGQWVPEEDFAGTQAAVEGWRVLAEGEVEAQELLEHLDAFGPAIAQAARAAGPPTVRLEGASMRYPGARTSGR